MAHQRRQLELSDQQSLLPTIGELVAKLNQPDCNPESRSAMIDLAKRCINSFIAESYTKTTEDISQIVQLATCADLTDSVSNCLSSELGKAQNISYQIDLIDALVRVNSCTSNTDQSQLIKQLNVFITILNDLHNKNPDTWNLTKLLASIGQFIDLLVDLDTIGSDKINSINEELDDHPDLDVRYLVAYIREGYKRLSGSDSRQLNVQRAEDLVKMAASLGSAAGVIVAAILTSGALSYIALTKAPQDLLVAYKSAKSIWESFHQKDQKAAWYDKLRTLSRFLTSISQHELPEMKSSEVNDTLTANKDSSDDIFLIGTLNYLSRKANSKLVHHPVVTQIVHAIFLIAKGKSDPWITGRSLMILMDQKEQNLNDFLIATPEDTKEEKLNGYTEEIIINISQQFLAETLIRDQFSDQARHFWINVFINKGTRPEEEIRRIRRIVLQTLLFIAKYNTSCSVKVRDEVIKVLQDKFKSKERPSWTQKMLNKIILLQPPRRAIPRVSALIKENFMRLSSHDQQLINPIEYEICRAFLNNEEYRNETRLYIDSRVTSQTSLSQTDTKVDDDNFTLEDAVRDFLSNPSKDVILLLGKAGSGKSTSLIHLTLKYCSEYMKHGVFLPIYIPLAGISNPYGELIPNALKILAILSAEKTDLLRANQSKILFIFDGYDEIDEKKYPRSNLYRLNHMETWKNCKIIISCRNDHLKGGEEYIKNFTPRPGNGIQVNNDAVRELEILPFDRREINLYMRDFLVINAYKISGLSSRWHIIASYTDWTDTLPGIDEMIKTPLFLLMTMETLPTIVEQYEKLSKNDQGKIRYNTDSLIKEYMKLWFEREDEKLRNDGQHPGGDIDMIVRYRKYCQDLAIQMEIHGRLTFSIYPDPQTDEEITMEKIFGRFFISEVELERKAAPLKKPAFYTYTFLHDLIRTYFAAAHDKATVPKSARSRK
jgi:hypothetical protein